MQFSRMLHALAAAMILSAASPVVTAQLPVQAEQMAQVEPSKPVEAQTAISRRRESLVREIRTALAERDLPAARSKLEQAEKEKGPASSVRRIEHLRLLYDYLVEFWQAVDQGGRTLQGGQELVIGSTRVAVVEYAAGRLVLRVEGMNRRYTLQTMPPRLALELAKRVLNGNAPENKVFFGVFLAVDAKGDKDKALALWKEAARAGVDISALLPGQDGSAAAEPHIEMPTLSRAARAVLEPRNWYLRRRSGDGWIRHPLDQENGRSSEEGRLLLTWPEAEKEAVQIVHRWRLSGNFSCRMILQDVGPSQTFGLFSTGSKTAACYVPLPTGTVLVEMARQDGRLRCRVNQREVEVQTTGAASARMLGYVGVTLPPGTNCTIAAYRFQGR